MCVECKECEQARQAIKTDITAATTLVKAIWKVMKLKPHLKRLKMLRGDVADESELTANRIVTRENPMSLSSFTKTFIRVPYDALQKNYKTLEEKVVFGCKVRSFDPPEPFLVAYLHTVAQFYLLFSKDPKQQLSLKSRWVTFHAKFKDNAQIIELHELWESEIQDGIYITKLTTKSMHFKIILSHRYHVDIMNDSGIENGYTYKSKNGEQNVYEKIEQDFVWEDIENSINQVSIIFESNSNPNAYLLNL